MRTGRSGQGRSFPGVTRPLAAVSLETAVSLVAVVALLVSSTAVSTGAVGLSDASSTAGTAQRGAVSPMVPVPAGATEVGAVDRGGSVTVEVELRSRDAAGLARLAADVSTPGRPDFHQYLARGSFARRFGADPTAVATLRHLALGAGLSVASVAPDGLTVTVSGQASRIERLFHTRLLRVRLPDGAIGRRAAGPATLPDPVAASVTAVVGLDDLVQRRPTSLIRNRPEPGGDRAGGQAAAVAGAGAPRSCPAAQALQDNGGALTDATIAQRYGVDGLEDDGADGRGQTVAVYELEPFALSDIAAFDTCYFGAAAAAAMVGRLSVVPVDGGQPAGAGVGEAALDIENVSALAPGARIEVYEAPNTTAGSLDEFSRIVTDDNAAVVTTSAGLCEAAMQADEPGVQALENQLFEQAAAQGQTVVAAAGDSGSSDCGTTGRRAVPPVLSVDDPASQPYVLSVGGTSESAGGTGPASAWSGGGGGLSASWEAPGWQLDDGVPGVADPSVVEAARHRSGSPFCTRDAAACREVPDVSAAADPAAGAVTVYYDGAWTSEGGTSSSAPLWAAVLTDTASTPACRSGLGFAVPLLYGVAADPSEDLRSFHDVTTGSNAVVPAAGGLFPATTGYDMATGLGTPRVTGPDGTPGLAAALCAAASGSGPGGDPPPTVDSLVPDHVPAAVTAGQPAPVVTVHGTGFEDSAGRPLVSSVAIGTDRLVAGTGRKAAVMVTGPTTLTVAVPPGTALLPTGGDGTGAGSYQVTVTTAGGGSSRPGPHSVLRYDAVGPTGVVPTVTAVGPTGGAPGGGGTVTVHGSGFSTVTAVEFGTVTAPHFTVVSDSELSVTVPAEGTTTRCANPTDRSTDICQVGVTVISPDGPSATVPIPPPYQGAITDDAYGGFPPPAGCHCETAPGPTEYDYVAPPTITSVTAATGADGRQYISAFGSSTVTVHGTGFDILGYQWTDIGASGEASSVDTTLQSISPTEVTLRAPAAPTGAVLPLAVPVSVHTLASPDGDVRPVAKGGNPPDVVFAPTPTVTRLVGGGRRSAGPTAGGTPLTVTGTGFEAATGVLLVDRTPGAPSLGTSTTFKVRQSTLRFTTPPAAVGIDDVLVCSATACSAADPAVDTFTYVAPGDPRLLSIGPDRGPATGGTRVKLTGTGLGMVMAVRFGNDPATTFSNPAGADDGGDPDTVVAVAPPGRAGAVVAVRVETLASLLDGSGFSPATPSAMFTYRGARAAASGSRPIPTP